MFLKHLDLNVYLGYITDTLLPVLAHRNCPICFCFFKETGLIQNAVIPSLRGQDDTYHRNSLDEFLEERRLSSFHFLLPFLSGLGFSSSHLSSGEPMVTGDINEIIKNKIIIQSWNSLNWQRRVIKLICWTSKTPSTLIKWNTRL